MQNSISLNEVVEAGRPIIRCNKCIVKQMVEYGDGCYWPSDDGKWTYFLPEVEVVSCPYLGKILKGVMVKSEDSKIFDKCEQFLPEIDWGGLRKGDIMVMQSLSDFIFLSTGIRTDSETLIEVFQEVRKLKNIRIVSNVKDGESVCEQFAYERRNYNLFGVIRDAVAEVSK